MERYIKESDMEVYAGYIILGFLALFIAASLIIGVMGIYVIFLQK